MVKYKHKSKPFWLRLAEQKNWLLEESQGQNLVGPEEFF
jgi:hypothetical protein